MSHLIRVPSSTSTSSSSSSVPSPHQPPRCRSSASTRSAKSSSHSKNHEQDTNQPHDIFTITDEVLGAQYIFEREIGYGNWGSIWRISPKNSSNRLHSTSKLAVKLVHRDKSSGTTATKIKSLWSEFKILRLFKSSPHPNVLRVSSFIITPSYALLTMAFHPSILPVRLGERSPRVRKYLRGLLAGTEFLHNHLVSHNDLKPANIVLSVDDEPVLIDFGFSVAYSSDYSDTTGKKPFMSTLSWGTPEYLSPQRAKAEEHDERLSDIWSLGVTLYEIVVGRTPFEADEKEEFLTKDALEVYYQRTLKGEFLGPHTLSPELKQLLGSMLRPDPAERLQSCSAGLSHAFFQRPSEPTGHQRRTSSIGMRGSERAPEVVSRRMQQLAIYSPSRPKTKDGALIHHKHTRSAASQTPTKAKLKPLVFEDTHATPKSGSHPHRPTPTRSVLASKTLNTPTTPRQHRPPAPRFQIQGKPTGLSPTKPASGVRALAACKPAVAPSPPRSAPAKNTAPSPRIGPRKRIDDRENVSKS